MTGRMARLRVSEHPQGLAFPLHHVIVRVALDRQKLSCVPWPLVLSESPRDLSLPIRHQNLRVGLLTAAVLKSSFLRDIFYRWPM